MRRLPFLGQLILQNWKFASWIHSLPECGNFACRKGHPEPEEDCFSRMKKIRLKQMRRGKINFCWKFHHMARGCNHSQSAWIFSSHRWIFLASDSTHRIQFFAERLEFVWRYAARSGSVLKMESLTKAVKTVLIQEYVAFCDPADHVNLDFSNFHRGNADLTQTLELANRNKRNKRFGKNAVHSNEFLNATNIPFCHDACQWAALRSVKTFDELL